MPTTLPERCAPSHEKESSFKFLASMTLLLILAAFRLFSLTYQRLISARLRIRSTVRFIFHSHSPPPARHFGHTSQI